MQHVSRLEALESTYTSVMILCFGNGDIHTMGGGTPDARYWMDLCKALKDFGHPGLEMLRGRWLKVIVFRVEGEFPAQDGEGERE